MRNGILLSLILSGCTLAAVCTHATEMPAPRFTDQLAGKTAWQVRQGAVRMGREALTIAAPNGWVRYVTPSLELPTKACTIAVSILVDDDFQDGLLLSDAYERTSLGTLGTTWPSLQVKALRTGPARFRVRFGYCSGPPPGAEDRWHYLSSPELPTGQWLALAFSWGPHGQTLWVGDRVRASSQYRGPYATDPSTPLFRGWGLGCLFNAQTPDTPDPAPERSAYAVRFRNLRMWSDQVWLGPRGKQR